MSVQILRGNALALPIEDDSVDLVVTSPPYFGLRSYQDGGEHYDGQIGSEATPAEFVDALFRSGEIPWRYALRCIDDLGLILRAEVIWSKPNGLPESVTDRVRRSHETWFHFTLNPRYYSAVDEIREEYSPNQPWGIRTLGRVDPSRGDHGQPDKVRDTTNPLGKLPGSVWTIPTQPLTVPPELGIEHFAAFPMEWPRRIVTGWSPREVCMACGEGRRPVADVTRTPRDAIAALSLGKQDPRAKLQDRHTRAWITSTRDVTGYACDCPEPTPCPDHLSEPAWNCKACDTAALNRSAAPATPGVVLDPFGGTGTTALVAHALGRHGISVDMSADYCRLARWRTSDPKELARAQQREYTPPREQVDGQETLFEGLGA
jgi:hypothetical protein